ncbi:hypothetical protein NECID01_1631 [Nematocida sp. AWRm77]|nr:hypothetical protein NECID01_1631 [Nematocida sp. AWRm77]
MHPTYAEFIETDYNMGAQRMIHIVLQSITAMGIKEGISRSQKHDMSMRSIYKKLFPPMSDGGSRVAAHRLKLYLQDGHEREALEQMKKITSFTETSIVGTLNYSFLLAVIKKMTGIVDAFLSKGFPKSVNARVLGSKGNLVFPTYFLLALAVQHLPVIILFFKRTVDFQEVWHGIGPVHLAAVNPDIRVLNMMLEQGGDPMEYTTTMQYSLVNGLSKKEDAACRSVGGRPIYPVDLSVLSGNWGAFLLLLKKCAKSVVHSQHVLHLLNSLEMTVKAISAGARIETTLFDGSSLLHTKAFYNKAEMAAFYIGLGLSLEEVNMRGETPLDIALQNNHKEAAWVLLSHGAKVSPRFQGHPIAEEIRLSTWHPPSTEEEKYRHYKEAAKHVVVVKHKEKSRFSITRMLYPEQRSIENIVKKLNEKIEKVGRSVPLFQSLPQKEIYDTYITMLSKKAKDTQKKNN